MTASDRLTPKQASLLAWITSFITTNGFPPSTREIAAGMGWSAAHAVQDMLRILVRKGYVLQTPRVSRGLSLTSKAASLAPAASTFAVDPLADLVRRSAPYALLAIERELEALQRRARDSEKARQKLPETALLSEVAIADAHYAGVCEARDRLLELRNELLMAHARLTSRGAK
jgi:SOS-response transcriptional repressor LexA